MPNFTLSGRIPRECDTILIHKTNDGNHDGEKYIQHEEAGTKVEMTFECEGLDTVFDQMQCFVLALGYTRPEGHHLGWTGIGADKP